MMFLHGVDPQRVMEVITGQRTGRGCGKTIAAMIKMLGHIKYSNNRKRYLMICENEEMANNASYYFYFWIHDSGYFTTNEANEGKNVFQHKIRILQPHPIRFWEAILSIFSKNRPPANVYVRFVPPSYKIQRGTLPYDEIIIDVSPETREIYKNEISQVLKHVNEDG